MARFVKASSVHVAQTVVLPLTKPGNVLTNLTSLIPLSATTVGVLVISLAIAERHVILEVPMEHLETKSTKR